MIPWGITQPSLNGAVLQDAAGWGSLWGAAKVPSASSCVGDPPPNHPADPTSDCKWPQILRRHFAERIFQLERRWGSMQLSPVRNAAKLTKTSGRPGEHQTNTVWFLGTVTKL